MLLHRSAQSCWHLAHRALARPAKATTGSPVATDHCPSVLWSALQVAALSLTRQLASQLVSPHRLYTQVAVAAEPQSPDIQLTEAAVEVSRRLDALQFISRCMDS